MDAQTVLQIGALSSERTQTLTFGYGSATTLTWTAPADCHIVGVVCTITAFAKINVLPSAPLSQNYIDDEYVFANPFTVFRLLRHKMLRGDKLNVMSVSTGWLFITVAFPEV